MRPTAAGEGNRERPGVPAFTAHLGGHLTPTASTAESRLWKTTTSSSSQRRPPAPLRCRATTPTQLSPRVDRRTGSGQWRSDRRGGSGSGVGSAGTAAAAMTLVKAAVAGGRSISRRGSAFLKAEASRVSCRRHPSSHAAPLDHCPADYAPAIGRNPGRTAPGVYPTTTGGHPKARQSGCHPSVPTSRGNAISERSRFEARHNPTDIYGIIRLTVSYST